MTFAQRIARARQWHCDNKPYFDAIYGPAPLVRRAFSQMGRKVVETEPRRWREDRRAEFDALYGPA